MRMPNGGLVAHSVGAGKTVIAIGLIASDVIHSTIDKPPERPTAVIVPDHIATQWCVGAPNQPTNQPTNHAC
jgi:SNF2 family DNA or RNA helicase